MKRLVINLSNQKNQHIVWLDVDRFIAMFTVVCYHCTDPFYFYPGTAPNIGEIKLLNEYGADISAQEERKVRLLLDRRDYFCAGVGEIYPMSELYEYKVHYMKELVSEASVQSGNIRVLICARSEWTRMFLSAAAADLNIIFDFTDRIFILDMSAEA